MIIEKALDNHILEPFTPIIERYKRYNLIYGGRSGGRSYFASQYALARLLKADTYFRCGIMRFVLGDIRNSIFREITDRIEEQKINDPELDIRPQPLVINFKRNTINGIGFRKSSSEQKAKLKSLAGYTDIIIEEAEEVSEEDFIMLDDSLRKSGVDIRIFLLFNLPDKNHWIVKRWFNLVDSGIDGFYIPEPKESESHNTEYVFTDYTHNEININQSTIENFERYKITNPDHYWNMIRGYVPSGKRGLVIKNVKFITNKDFEAIESPSFYGLDFGFTNDPTALIEIKKHNEKVYARELIYETGLLNKSISARMIELGINKNFVIYADSAEPKSIEDLVQMGWNVLPAEKGAGSVNAGLDLLQSCELHITENSRNLIVETQNYVWGTGRDKEPTNTPIDNFNHGIDALRYGVYTKSKQRYIGF